jgi:hypothetical protein
MIMLRMVFRLQQEPRGVVQEDESVGLPITVPLQEPQDVQVQQAKDC